MIAATDIMIATASMVIAATGTMIATTSMVIAATGTATTGDNPGATLPGCEADP
jgi:hypothetical protein